MKKGEIAFFVFSLIVFFEPQFFKEDSIEFAVIIDNIYKFLKITCAVIISWKYIKNKKMSKLVFLTIGLQGITFISTIINKGSMLRLVGPAITTVVMVMICEILIEKKELVNVLKKINIYFRCCFILNLISIVLVDFTGFEEVRPVYFLGIDNRFIFTFLPWILFEGITSYLEYGKLTKRYYICFVATEIVLFYRYSLSAMLSLLLFLVPIIKNIHFARFKNIAFIGMIISNITLTVSNMTEYLGKILKFMHKDVTLSGRTFLWEGVMEELKTSPFIGKGMKSIADDKMFFYESTKPYYLEFCKVVHSHNSFMTILYRGGILSLMIYLIIFYKSLKNLKKNRNHILANLLFIALIIVMVTSLFDTMDFAGLYFIFALCCSISKIEYEGVN